METDSLDIAGFREWLPIELAMDPAEYVESIVDHFSADPAGPETIRAMAQGLTSLSRQLTDLDDEETLTLAAWALLPPGGDQLVLQTVARMQLVRIYAGMTADELVADMIGNLPLHQPIGIDTLDTASGPAQLVRVRTYETTPEGTNIQETVCVFWLPEGENYAVVLVTLPIDDLVVASDAARALAALAETVKGIPA
jgi:hypothetical protein